MRWKKSPRSSSAQAPPADVHGELAAAVEDIYGAAADPAALRAAIERFLRRLERLPAGDPYRGLYWGVAATAYADLNRLTGRISDLRTAISFGERADADIPADDPQRHNALNRLGANFMTLYLETHEPADLDAGIAHLRRCLATTVPPAGARADILNNLGLGCEWRFQRTGDPADCDAMIEAYEQALAGSTEHRQEARIRSALLTGYVDRFMRTGAREDIDTAIAHGEAARGDGGAGESGQDTHVFLLAVAYQERYALAGEPEDLDRMIDCADRAATLDAATDPERAGALALAAEGYRRRFDRTTAATDLDSGIERLRRAVAAGTVGDPQRARWQSNLGTDQLSRFRLTGDERALEDALALGGQAVAGLPSDHPDQSICMGNLAMAYHARYGLRGDIADLHTSVELDQRALAVLPADSHRRGAVLANLATSCLDLFTRTGAREDIDDAVEHGERALSFLGSDEADRSACLSILGSAYRRRYERFGATADLDAAVQRGEQAVRALPAGHPQRTQRLMNSAIAYAARFRVTGVPDDLDTAISRGEEASAGPFLKYDDLALGLSNLSDYYRERFDANRDPADLESSIQCAERGLAALPADHPRRISLSAALAGAYLSRHRHAGVPTDLDSAVRLSEQALNAGPGNIGLVANLAVAYREQAAHGPLPRGTVSRLVEAASPFDRPGTALSWPEGSARTEGFAAAGPAERGSAQVNIGILALDTGMVEDAALMFRLAVETLAQCAPRELEWADREHLLGAARGLVGDAVAAHVATGDLPGAVELAELGRGIMLTDLWDLRTDLQVLAAAAPELAAEFDDVRRELDARPPADVEDGGAVALAAWQARRHAVADRWDEVLRRIRGLPGFAGFLDRPRFAELQQAATDGAVVVVNVGRPGGDAIILRPGSVDAVRLGDLTLAEAQSRVESLAGVERRDGSTWVTRSRGATEDLLAWVWETVTAPVLASLGHDRPPPAGESPPRIWWVPTGVLSLLPLHAAGLPGGPSALDLVTSSYAPTIGTILNGRRRRPSGARSQLTVTMRHTPGLPELPGTTAEAAHLRLRHPGTAQLDDARATAGAVLSALPGATWAHFACHAASHPATPSRSGLHLHDGVLSVPQIGRLRLDGELAYLSACSTGQSSLLQADEAMHLASAFQLAGYRHVVGTLWPIDDTVAARAARRFYRIMGDTPTADGAAAALNQVTREIRDASPADPSRWAPFIHSGP